MTTSTKYPNADTSPERLAEIMQILTPFHRAYRREDMHDSTNVMIFDLLAMLDELGSDRIRLALTTQETTQAQNREYAKQLHDQRWRPTTEEMPLENERVNVLVPHGDHPRVMYYNKSYGLPWRDGFGLGIDLVTHWRPIPPLPKE